MATSRPLRARTPRHRDGARAWWAWQEERRMLHWRAGRGRRACAVRRAHRRPVAAVANRAAGLRRRRTGTAAASPLPVPRAMGPTVGSGPSGPRVRSARAVVKGRACDNRRVVPRLYSLAVSLVTAAVMTATGPAIAGRLGSALPAEIPAGVRARLAPVVDDASLSTRVQGNSFVTRRDVFEYLLEHPEFATHVTRALKVARYRIWRTPSGLMLDDGWGAVGALELVYGAPGLRVMYAKGEYHQAILPNIRGQAVVTIDWTTTAAPGGKNVIAPTVGAYVKLDSRALSLATALAGSVAAAKAEKEASRLVRVFEKTTRALDDNPAAVLEAL